MSSAEEALDQRDDIRGLKNDVVRRPDLQDLGLCSLPMKYNSLTSFVVVSGRLQKALMAQDGVQKPLDDAQ